MIQRLSLRILSRWRRPPGARVCDGITPRPWLASAKVVRLAGVARKGIGEGQAGESRCRG